MLGTEPLTPRDSNLTWANIPTLPPPPHPIPFSILHRWYRERFRPSGYYFQEAESLEPCTHTCTYAVLTFSIRWPSSEPPPPHTHTLGTKCILCIAAMHQCISYNITKYQVLYDGGSSFNKYTRVARFLLFRKFQYEKREAAAPL